MSNKFRLSSGGEINRTERVSFKFNKKTFFGYKGDTLASALLANGIHLVARSFKYHRPRGFLGSGSGNFFAHTIAKDEPHKLNASFNINRFVSGDLVDEHGAAAVAH